MSRTYTVAILFSTAMLVGPAWTSSATQPVATPLVLEEPAQDKIFYLHRLLETPAVIAALREHAPLGEFSTRYRARLVEAESKCGRNAPCYVESARVTEPDIETVGSALRDLHKREPVIRNAAQELRKSGTMIRYPEQNDAELLVAAWRLCAKSINLILSTYGDGSRLNVPSIDSMRHDPQAEKFGVLIRTAMQIIIDADAERGSFLSGPVHFAMLVLAIDGRGEAGWFEPIEQGENRAAYEEIRRTDWSGYRHSVIIVPGDGPSDQGVRLSPNGRLRLELAVERYRHRAAPLILVSGGNVHPPRTPYNEAIEMKRALIEDHRIPASAILVDPHARHTTTNLRNAARIVYRYAIPFERPMLVVTSELHADYIMGPTLDERSLRETDTLPYTNKRRLSKFEIELWPSIDALQVGWQDPLDP